MFRTLAPLPTTSPGSLRSALFSLHTDSKRKLLAVRTFAFLRAAGVCAGCPPPGHANLVAAISSSWRVSTGSRSSLVPSTPLSRPPNRTCAAPEGCTSDLHARVAGEMRLAAATRKGPARCAVRSQGLVSPSLFSRCWKIASGWPHLRGISVYVVRSIFGIVVARILGLKRTNYWGEQNI